MMAIRSEISKYEDTLKEYQLYKKFLEALTPKVITSFFLSLCQTTRNVFVCEQFCWL